MYLAHESTCPPFVEVCWDPLLTVGDETCASGSPPHVRRPLSLQDRPRSQISAAAAGLSQSVGTTEAPKNVSAGHIMDTHRSIKVECRLRTQ